MNTKITAVLASTLLSIIIMVLCIVGLKMLSELGDKFVSHGSMALSIKDCHYTTYPKGDVITVATTYSGSTIYIEGKWKVHQIDIRADEIKEEK